MIALLIGAVVFAFVVAGIGVFLAMTVEGKPEFYDDEEDGQWFV